MFENGMSMGEICNLEKEQVRAALNEWIAVDEDEFGFVYEKASREECSEFILDMFDELVQRLMNAEASAKALGRVLSRHQWSVALPEYTKAVKEELLRFRKYRYEPTLAASDWN